MGLSDGLTSIEGNRRALLAANRQAPLVGGICRERRMLARHADCDGRVLTVVAIADGEVAGVMERASN